MRLSDSLKKSLRRDALVIVTVGFCGLVSMTRYGAGDWPQWFFAFATPLLLALTGALTSCAVIKAMTLNAVIVAKERAKESRRKLEQKKDD